MTRATSGKLLLSSLIAGAASAQEPGNVQETELASGAQDEERVGTTLVTATLSEQSWLEAPWSTAVVSEEEILARAVRTLPQTLSGIPGVSVQETAYGQGSPYLRGFTGYQTLMLIDGIRLNNSVFRSGPNQYWSTVDTFTLERVEVVKGPSSVLYGSDAIGGTVNAITRGPYTYGPGLLHGESFTYRIGSADQSHVLRGELSVTAGETLGLLAGGTGRSFDDLSGGNGTGIQPNSGYDEWDADLKLEHFLGRDERLVFAYQRVQQDDAPRTHRTIFAVPFEGTTVGTDLRHDLDQDRSLAYLQLRGAGTPGGIESYQASVSWQGQEETLKRVTGGGAASEQGFDVGTFGLFAWGSSPSSIGRWTYGFDAYHDDVDSSSSTQPIQGPVADDATYDLLGVFLQDEIAAGARTSFTVGTRFNHAAADADSVLEPVSGMQTSLEDDWSALVGSVRFLHRVREGAVHLFGGVSQGFRAPNLSDLTRLDTARSNEFEIPSPGLDPEHYTSYELGLKGARERATAQLSFFYTDIEDQILRVPTGDVTPDGDAVVTKENVGDGYVYGVEAESAVGVGRGWTLFGGATFVEGQVETFPTSAPVAEEEYIDKLMPLHGQVGARWEDERRWVELVTQAAADADKLSTADTLDTQRIPPGGTPSYVVFHARGGVRLGKYATLDLALENLTDEDYRVHGSGLNRAGRNLIVSLTLGR